MTPAEALKLIDQLLASISANRADHVRMQQAIRTLDEFVVEHTTPETTPDTDEVETE